MNFLLDFVHESARVAAYLYYGEKRGEDSWMNGPAVLMILKKCGILATERGCYREDVGEPFVSVVLERFGLNSFGGNAACKPRLITR